MVLVLAGGSGTRFWPASRRAQPKHLLPLLPGGETLLRATLRRVADLGGGAQVNIVTAEDQVAAVQEDLRKSPVGAVVVAEPAARNTAPAILWALAGLLATGGDEDAPIVVLPSDAWVDDDAGFRSCLERACERAQDEQRIVTIGVPPDRPATGYGYLELAALPGEDSSASLPVVRFCEKPSAELAEEFLAGGRHLWNAGIFVFTARTMRRVVAEVAPVQHALFEGLLEHFAARDFDGARARYKAADPISVDYAVMERAGDLLCQPATFGWSDLGAWDALEPVLERTEGAVHRSAALVAEESVGNVVFAPDKSVALLGVEGLILVSTDDAILVASKDKAQSVRDLHAKLGKLGWDDLL